jgi:hypothetical protein
MRDNFIKRLKDKEDFCVVVDSNLSAELQTLSFCENVFWAQGQRFVCFTEFTLLIFQKVSGKFVIKCAEKEMLDSIYNILSISHVLYNAKTDTFK